MTMVEGWVVERVSEDPTVLPLGGTPVANAESPVVSSKKSDRKKRDKKRDRKTDAKKTDSKKTDAKKKDVVVEPQVAVAETVEPETFEPFEPLVITPLAEPAAATKKTKKDKKDKSDEDSKGGKVLTACLALCVVGAIGYFSFPYLASLLEEPEVAVFTANGGEPTQRYVIDGDTMYLEGSVPNEGVSDAIEDAAQGALGQDRVINNFEISADAVYDPQAPVQLTVAETVQFGTGRADVAEQYAPLIDLAVELMTSQPNVSLTIIGHTDNIGDEALNLRLSSERAQATAETIRDRGIDIERLTIEGRGEAEPVDTNETPEGRQANRRVEFLVRGLLG